MSEIRLKQVLGRWDATLYIICGIIGSGIFISPKGVLEQTGSGAMALLMWLVTGLINLATAFCYAELALTIPKAGSDYTYINECFGEFFSFLYIWVNFAFQDGCSRAVVALTFSTYFTQMFFPCGIAPESLKRLIAALALALLTAGQCYSTKFAVKTANTFTIAKLIGLAVIIVCGIGYIVTGHAEKNLNELADDANTDLGAYALAFYSANWAYGGINNAMNFVEDIRQDKGLKVSIIFAVVVSQSVIMAVYLVTNLAYLAVLSTSELLASEAVAMTFAGKIFSGLFWIMPFFVACSTFGTMNNSIMNSSRLVFAATRRGHLPKPLTLLQKDLLTPIPILITNLIISFALLCTDQVGNLILYTGYTSTLGIALAILALIILRFKRPLLERPFKLPVAIPIFTLGVLIVLLVFPLVQNTRVTLFCFAFIASGIPIYFLLIRPDNINSSLSSFQSNATKTMQKICLAIPEHGGKMVTGQDNKAFSED